MIKLNIFTTMMIIIYFTLVQSAPTIRQVGGMTDDERFSYCVYNNDSPNSSIIELAKKCLIEVTGVTIQDPTNH